MPSTYVVVVAKDLRETCGFGRTEDGMVEALLVLQGDEDR